MWGYLWVKKASESNQGIAESFEVLLRKREPQDDSIDFREHSALICLVSLETGGVCVCGACVCVYVW